jgi:hypothetical protein
MQGVYASSATIIRRLKLELPVSVTYEDPFTGEPITCHRDNMLALLVVDTHNLVVEGQTCAALYAEMGRFARAAEYAAGKADTAYVRWKAEKANEARGKSKAKLTKEQVENFYRTHDEYEQYANEPKKLLAQAGLFEDLRWAFKLKGETHSDQTRLLGGHERTMRKDDEVERLAELESLQAEASKVIEESGSADAAADIAAQVSGTEVSAPPTALEAS